MVRVAPSAPRRTLGERSAQGRSFFLQTSASSTRRAASSTRRALKKTFRTSVARLEPLAKTTKRARWKLDWFPGTLGGQLVSQLLAAGALVLLATLWWGWLGGDRVMEDLGESSEINWKAASWHAWSLFFDPGTQTGLSGNSTVSIKCAAAIISLLGFVFNLTMMGFIVEFLKRTMEELGELYGRDVV